MIALALMMTAALGGPDAVPALEAVKTCNRDSMARLVKAEPRRRAEFAAAAYAEQQAIARERAVVLARDAAETVPAGKAAIDQALAQLDARQKLLGDAHAVETGWRTMFVELRSDYLANCAQAKGGKAP